MKVFKTDVNKISLNSIILQLQLTLRLSLFKEIISVYSDLLVLISNYSFLFENLSSEIQALKRNPFSVVVALISEAPARDGSNWYGYAGQNPMVYVDRIGLFYYTGNVQQSSNNTNQAGTESAETPSATPQNQSPNITGPTGEQTPAVPNVETDGKYSSRRLNAGLQIILGIEVGIEMNISWVAWTKLWSN